MRQRTARRLLFVLISAIMLLPFGATGASAHSIPGCNGLTPITHHPHSDFLSKGAANLRLWWRGNQAPWGEQSIETFVPANKKVYYKVWFNNAAGSEWSSTAKADDNKRACWHQAFHAWESTSFQRVTIWQLRDLGLVTRILKIFR